MSDDEYPNFGGAWTSTSTAPVASTPASWNPALRPDSHASTQHHDVQQAELVAEHALLEQQEESIPAAQVPSEVDSHHGHRTDQHELEADEEAAVLEPNESGQEQKAGLDKSLALPSREPMLIASPGLETPMAWEEEEEYMGGSSVGSQASIENSYDYQGETLEMEEAVDEAPDAPLLDDPEEPPVVQEIKREPTLHEVREESILDPDNIHDLDHSPTTAKVPLAHIDRSFTTNFTEVQTPVEDAQDLGVMASTGWPSAGDDKTFGELLGDEAAFAATSKDSAADVLHNDAADDGWGGADDDTFGELLGNDGGVLDIEPKVDNGVSEDLTAAWQAALDDDDLLDEPEGLDPSTLFGDDDPGFLDDDLIDSIPAAVPQLESSRQGTASPYVPAAAQVTAAPRSQYAASLQQGHARSAGTPSTGLYDVYGHGATFQQAPPQRPPVQSAQSFVDKAKGGYQSPYDLPMEVVKQPRQRPRQVQTDAQTQPAAPPRTSSMSSQTGPFSIRPATSGSGASMSPPASAGSISAVPTRPSASIAPPKKPAAQVDSGFFADLPVAARPRARMSGVFTPQPQPMPTPPPDSISGQMQARAPSVPTQPPQQPVAPQAPPQPLAPFGGLSRPERLPLLPDEPTADRPFQMQAPAVQQQGQRYSPNSLPTPPQQQNRFSPAPPSQGQTSASRYSPAPASQAGGGKKYSISGPGGGAPPFGIQNSHPFAPRTSSPLAFSADKAPALLGQDGVSQLPQTPVSPPKPSGTRSASTMSPDHLRSASYTPNGSRTTAGTGLTSPPQRAVSQSPAAVNKPARYSTQTATVPTASSVDLANAAKRSNFLPHRRQMSRELNFAPPSDEHAHDPLERWKGHPIFRWGESGVVVSSFPKQTPFYAAGHGIPSVKCTPGGISIQQASTFMPMEERNAKFPGPLTARAKGRKKDVLSWMSSKIEDIERRTEFVRMDFEMDSDLKKRTEEKLVLWRLVKVFVEHDGKLEGDKKIEDEVRTVLLPNLAQMSQVSSLRSPLSGDSVLQTDGVDRTIIFQLRQALLEGNREKAVWLAEENKLWGHAMLVASTMGPDIWKQIIQSFVRSQVKTVGSDARSLAALYQVFAGNSEECVDELVPPSARAGFKMVSKSDGAVSGNPLEGLDQWRETLGLVAGNRTSADQQSLLALGKLLSGYGRAEAAHSCFLFARQIIKHSGADDGDASFVILGSNQKPDESSANDIDAIILTEIYEWACSLSSPSNAVHYIPHLQSFKLMHAQELAACGLKSKAQAYCDHITSAYTSTTRPSPYYHPTFTQAVNDLSAFLSQTPQSGTAGLLSKGAMNKVSSGAASWFTKFVSGEDDRESTGSGPGNNEDGPFGRVNGDSPSISRRGSQTDLYSSMMGGNAPYAPGVVGSPPKSFTPSSVQGRYAPLGGSSKYAPGPMGGLGTSAQRLASPARPSSSRSYAPAQPLSVPRPDTGRSVSDYSAPYGSDSRRGSAQYPGSQGSYEPRPSLTEETSTYGYQPPASEEPSSTFNDAPSPFGNTNGVAVPNDSATDAEGGGYTHPLTSYEPPSGGYEPPSYQPYQADAEPDSVDETPKPKKSFMDDEDDDAHARQSVPMKKAEADRQADEAFRKAAEADAARDKTNAGAGDRRSWFGGWFGKKDPNAPQAGPIRAKLGEENSFVYDENLKKWVNKKGGSEASTPAAATPPPPRGPPNRAVSAAMGPPSGPPSRVASASSIGPPGARSPTSTAGPPGGSPAVGPPSGPTSRTGTPATGDASPMPAAVVALSNGETRPTSAPPGRPASGMSNASSLDDLLGGPPGPGQRKAGGTVRGKKKGARYVDVMQSG